MLDWSEWLKAASFGTIQSPSNVAWQCFLLSLGLHIKDWTRHQTVIQAIPFMQSDWVLPIVQYKMPHPTPALRLKLALWGLLSTCSWTCICLHLNGSSVVPALPLSSLARRLYANLPERWRSQKAVWANQQQPYANGVLGSKTPHMIWSRCE
jgi:hypothetical protein